MKLWEFNKLKQLPNYFLFYGDEFYLEFYYQKISSMYDDIFKLYYDEVDIDVAKSYLSQKSLFGDKNVLIIKTDKWVDVKKLVELSDDNIFYYFYYGDVKKAKTSIFKNNFVRFFKPDLKELIILSNEYMKMKNITNIDLLHLKHLISKVDYRFLFREIDKLSVIDHISNELIDQLVFDYNETSFDEIFDKLFQKEDYLKSLKFVLIQYDEIAILLSLIRYVKILYMFNLHLKNIGFENVSKDVLGYQLPKNVEEFRKKIAISIKEDNFLEIFEILLSAELAIKSSKDKTAILFLVFIQISNIL